MFIKTKYPQSEIQYCFHCVGKNVNGEVVTSYVHMVPLQCFALKANYILNIYKVIFLQSNLSHAIKVDQVHSTIYSGTVLKPTVITNQ